LEGAAVEPVGSREVEEGAPRKLPVSSMGVSPEDGTGRGKSDEAKL